MPKIDGIELMIQEFEERYERGQERRKKMQAGGNTSLADVPTVPITIAKEVEYEEIDACCPPARVFGIPSPPAPISPSASSSVSETEDHRPLFLSADSAVASVFNGNISPGQPFSISPNSSNATSVGDEDPLGEEDPLPTKPHVLPLVNEQA